MQVIVLWQEPVMHILHSFWSIHLMNYATWEGIYSLYPVSTLDMRSMVVVKSLSRKERVALDKYVQRGFRLTSLNDVWHLEEFHKSRTVRDELVRRVSLGSSLSEENPLRLWRFRLSERGVEYV